MTDDNRPENEEIAHQSTTDKVDAKALKELARERRCMDAPCPYLLVTGGPLKHKKVLLVASRTLVGRGEDCHVIVKDPYISASHLALIRRPEGVFAEDLGSANGTRLNGRPLVETCEIRHGDRLRIGNTEMEFRVPEAE